MNFFIILTIYILSANLTSAKTNNIVDIKANFETTPIPLGEDTTDDAAIWFNEMNPSKSILLGVNKNKEEDGGRGGVGLYSLDGKEIKFYENFHGVEIGRLNNIDLRYNFSYNEELIDLVVASNRSKDLNGNYKGLSLFSMEGEKRSLNHLVDIPLKNEEGVIHEPYGSCMGFDPNSKRYYVISPLENGLILQHEITSKKGILKGELKRTIDMGKILNREQDAIAVEMTLKGVLQEYLEGEFNSGELNNEIKEKLGERYQMEGCVSDDQHGFVYVGMEKLGIFKFSLNPILGSAPELVASINKSKHDKNKKDFPVGVPRLSDDVEGLAIYHGQSGEGYLIASIQGLSEFAVFTRKDQKYLGSFSIYFNQDDRVTKTDGFDILSSPMGTEFKNGLMVVHDDENTDENGALLNANYKILSFEKVLNQLGLDPMIINGWIYNPLDLSK